MNIAKRIIAPVYNEAADIALTVANKYRENFCDGRARKLLDGEQLHPLCANFIGPGTRIDIPENLNYPPYNEVDALAKIHDISYGEAFAQTDDNKRKKMLREADEVFLRDIEKYSNEFPYYSLAKRGIQLKNVVEDYTPQLAEATLGKYSAGCKECGFNELFGGSILKMVPPEKRIFSKKKPDSYSDEIKNAISLISINHHNDTIVGSATFKAYNYYNDIDTFEVVTECCDPEMAVNRITTYIRILVTNILNTEGAYFIEFKCGLDNRYFVNIGGYKGDKLVEYNYEKIIDQFNILYNVKLLTEKELEKCLSLVHKKPTYEQFLELHKEIRQYYIVRWTAEEVIKGEKKLRGGKIKKLSDALLDKSNIVLDLWVFVHNMYKEISTVFVIAATDGKGNTKLVNYDCEYKELATQLKECLNNDHSLKYDIGRLSTKVYYNPFKVAKRIFSYAARKNDYKTGEKLLKLFNGDTGYLAHQNNQIKLINDMITKLDEPPIKLLWSQLQFIKSKLAHITEFKIDEARINRTIDGITEKGRLDRKSDSKKLEDIHTFFQKLIDINSERYLKNIGFWPPPSKYIEKRYTKS